MTDGTAKEQGEPSGPRPGSASHGADTPGVGAFRFAHLIAIATAVATILVAVGAPATAVGGPVHGRAKIEVFPGKHALARALAGAEVGDELLLHTGSYHEHVTVSTQGLLIHPFGDGPVVVDGKCLAQVTIAVLASDVSIIGLRVQGASEGFGGPPTEIDYEAVQGGLLSGVLAIDTCDAEYGVRVEAGGGVSLTGGAATGFSVAGIDLAGVTDPSGVKVVGMSSYENARGVVIEDSVGSSASILITRSNVYSNVSSGIYVANSDGIQVKSDTVTVNGTSGVELDGTSDRNRVEYVTSSGQTYDMANDGGTGNCFVHDRYATSFGTISC